MLEQIINYGILLAQIVAVHMLLVAFLLLLNYRYVKGVLWERYQHYLMDKKADRLIKQRREREQEAERAVKLLLDELSIKVEDNITYE